MTPWWELLILFLLGQMLYVLKRAAFAKRNPDNPVASVSEYVSKNWDALVVRVGIGQILFWMWRTWPDGLSKLISLIGLHFDLDIPPLPVVAAGAGFAMDAWLDFVTSKIPFLGSIIPNPLIKKP